MPASIRLVSGMRPATYLNWHWREQSLCQRHTPRVVPLVLCVPRVPLRGRGMSNPYMFIVGYPRSGTTLLQRMVNAHPDIAITPESHWIPRLYVKAWALTSEGRVKPKLIRRLLGHPKFGRLKISPEEIVGWTGNGKQISYGNLVSRIFDHY